MGKARCVRRSGPWWCGPRENGRADQSNQSDQKERQGFLATIETPVENPRDSVNWRRHRNGCPNYRVRWFPENDFQAGEPMYQVYCLMNTPPQTFDEQEKCLNSKTRCWRLAEAAKKGADGPIPVSSVKRRKPA